MSRRSLQVRKRLLQRGQTITKDTPSGQERRDLRYPQNPEAALSEMMSRADKQPDSLKVRRLANHKPRK